MIIYFFLASLTFLTISIIIDLFEKSNNSTLSRISKILTFSAEGVVEAAMLIMNINLLSSRDCPWPLTCMSILLFILFTSLFISSIKDALEKKK